MSKHTPGPWTLHTLLSGSENDKGFRVTGEDEMESHIWIADVSPVIDNERGDASEEGKANARLIAAAPDLLASLERIAAMPCITALLGEEGECGCASCDARAAIAKAEGR